VLLNQTKIKFKFDVERVVVIASRCDAKNSFVETHLAELVLTQIGARVDIHEYNTDAVLELKAFSVNSLVDRTKNMKPVHLISSGTHEHDGEMEKEEALVRVLFNSVSPESPEFRTKYGDIEKTLKVSMSSLNILVESYSILALQEFALDTFSEDTPSNADQQVITDDDEEEEQVDDPTYKKRTAKTKVVVTLHAIHIAIANRKEKIAIASIEGISANAELSGKTIQLDAHLESLAVADAQKTGSTSAKLLEIAGEELVSLRYETFDPVRPNYPGYDTSIKLRLGSLQFTFLDQLVKRLVAFGGNFSHLQSLSNAARRTASKSAEKLQEKSSNILMDILVLSPVLIFPCGISSNTEKDAIRVHLGELSLKNELQEDPECAESDAKIEHIKLNLQACSVFSELDLGRGRMEQQHIIKEICFSLNLVRAKPLAELGRPEMKVGWHA
jgi:vacuolar protein sorting-associated protein 13A/C